MAKNLVIVESPAKAKTIEKYLGKDFEVLSSIGHIRSIAKKVKGGVEPIDIKNGFKTTYQVDPEKTKVITQLKKAAKNAQEVWLATDEDREGEAIAWHLCEVLKLDLKKTKRIAFHEITKHAIEEAIKNPGIVDMNLVQAQQARQILDRIVGFELSPVVWKKVPGGKSAGRVQSPAVRLLVEREREIRSFEGSFSFKVSAQLIKKGSKEVDSFKAELDKKLKTKAEGVKLFEHLAKKGTALTINAVEKKPGVRNPGAPFTTSSLQQEANRKLSMSAKATMSAAQKLYQAGKITYMRTDSVNLSNQSLAQMDAYIKKEYGDKYHKFRTFKTKSSGAQEAHEAIRPTNVAEVHASSNDYEQRLYDLIRRRTLSTQMAPAQIEKTNVVIDITDSKHKFKAKGEIVVFDGFLKLYEGMQKDEILPDLSAGDDIDVLEAEARQKFDNPPARYSEGSLVKKLEELGIGRPSTYATIIDTVQTRGYAEKGQGEGQERSVDVVLLKGEEVRSEEQTEKTGADKGKLVPTPAGELISDFLSDYFKRVVDYGFTADVEKEFDLVADGKLERNKMLEQFYGPFSKLIDKSDDIDRNSVSQDRKIGVDPKTKKPVIARFGRYGPMLQLGEAEDDEKPRFAPMPEGARIDNVTMEQALEMFKLPRLLGMTEDGLEIRANIGRFGPYIQVGKLFVSIKPEDPRHISLETALKLYAEKLKAEAEKNIAIFEDGIKVLNGRYGPYITDGKKNAKIPKDIDPKKITHEDAKKILKEAPAKRGRGGKAGKGSKKRTTKAKASTRTGSRTKAKGKPRAKSAAPKKK